MITFEALDALTTGAFVPYRDASGRPRLLDVQPPSSASTRARPFYRRLASAVKAAATVVDETSYRAWYSTQWEPLALELLSADLGSCVGDEGHELRERCDQVLDAVWRPGWRVEDRHADA